MACPFCRFGAWLLGKQNSIHEPPRPQSPPSPQDVAPERVPLCSSPNRHEPPPPSREPPLTQSSGSKSLDALRERTPSRSYHALVCEDMAPPVRDTAAGTIYAAIATATNGMMCALADPDPAIAAAIAVRAIRLAVSTSESYHACVAATTAAEFEALLSAQVHQRPNSDPYPYARYQEVVDAAFEATNTYNDTADSPLPGWPWNTYDDVDPEADAPASSTQHAAADEPLNDEDPSYIFNRACNRQRATQRRGSCLRLQHSMQPPASHSTTSILPTSSTQHATASKPLNDMNSEADAPTSSTQHAAAGEPVTEWDFALNEWDMAFELNFLELDSFDIIF